MSTIFSDGTRVNGTNRDEALYRRSQLPYKHPAAIKPKPHLNHARNVAARKHNNEVKRNATAQNAQNS